MNGNIAPSASTHTTFETGLFPPTPEEQIILSVRLLVTPNRSHLYDLHRDLFASYDEFLALMEKLTHRKTRKLNMLKPIVVGDEFTTETLQPVYQDTAYSRRVVADKFKIKYVQPPEQLRSPNWSFLEHDVRLAGNIVSFQLTARKLQKPFFHQPTTDLEGNPIYPRVTVTDDRGELPVHHTFRPIPDWTLIIGEYVVIHESDRGKENIGLGVISRDNTIMRKNLAYEEVERSKVFTKYGWKKVIYVYDIQGRRKTEKASKSRVKGCIEQVPELGITNRTYYINREALERERHDISGLEFFRADGVVERLPCFR